jgi:hypothetical protein
MKFKIEQDKKEAGVNPPERLNLNVVDEADAKKKLKKYKKYLKSKKVKKTLDDAEIEE